MTKWKVIPGYSKYEVSDAGQIRRSTKEKIRYGVGRRLSPGTLLKMNTMKHGYERCSIFDDGGIERTMTAHHAVALAFCGPRPTLEHHALHWDDNPSNSNYKNIRWGLPKDNAQDAERNGKILRGERQGNSKLTDLQVREIKKRFPVEGRTLKAFGEEFNVSLHTIHLIVTNKHWKHI